MLSVQAYDEIVHLDCPSLQAIGLLHPVPSVDEATFEDPVNACCRVTQKVLSCEAREPSPPATKWNPQHKQV